MRILPNRINPERMEQSPARGVPFVRIRTMRSPGEAVRLGPLASCDRIAALDLLGIIVHSIQPTQEATPVPLHRVCLEVQIVGQRCRIFFLHRRGSGAVGLVSPAGATGHPWRLAGNRVWGLVSGGACGSA